VQGLLSAYGYRWEAYASAEEFMALAEESKACCLLTDIELGGMSGIQMVRELAKTGLRFPTIFMTGSASALHRQDALRMGCLAFLEKPFSAPVLLDAVANAVMAFEKHGVRRQGSGCPGSP
jgi:FixJ family two-component response regulator